MAKPSARPRSAPVAYQKATQSTVQIAAEAKKNGTGLGKNETNIACLAGAAPAGAYPARARSGFAVLSRDHDLRDMTIEIGISRPMGRAPVQGRHHDRRIAGSCEGETPQLIGVDRVVRHRRAVGGDDLAAIGADRDHGGDLVDPLRETDLPDHLADRRP